MIQRPPRSTRTYTLCPYTTRFRTVAQPFQRWAGQYEDRSLLCRSRVAGPAACPRVPLASDRAQNACRAQFHRLHARTAGPRLCSPSAPRNPSGGLPLEYSDRDHLPQVIRKLPAHQGDAEVSEARHVFKRTWSLKRSLQRLYQSNAKLIPFVNVMGTL